MATTPNMSLKTWDNLSDRFNHLELSENFQAIDDHDHAATGVKIPAGGIDALAIATSNYQDLSVTEEKLADDSVSTDKIQNGAVTTGKVADGAITTLKMDPTVASDFQDAIDQGLADLQAMYVTPEAWKTVGTDPAWMNSWTNVTALGSVQFYRDPFERVWLKGGLQGGALNSGAFTLPVGYRPATQEAFSSIQGRVDVLANGQVVPQATSIGWVTLSGVSFRVA